MMAAKTGKVALVYTKNHSEGVNKAVRLLNINPVKGKAVALKPNFNTADPFPASTHNDALHALITMLQELGAASIVIAERSGPSNTEDVMKEKGIFAMSKELGFSLINLDKVDAGSWVHQQPEGSHWANGFNVARVYAEAECVVQTCCLKTHRYGGHFTISLKNSVGMVERCFMSELHKNPSQSQMIAEITPAYTQGLLVR